MNQSNSAEMPAAVKEAGGEASFVELVGLRVARISSAELLDRIFGDLARSRGGSLITANVDFLQRAARSPDIRALYSRADLIVADGKPLLWAANLQGQPLPERVAGSDLVWTLAERAAREGRSLYLLGGAADAASRAAELLRSRFPTLRLAGHSNPWLSLPPSPEEIEPIRRELKRVRPDILFAGFGSPKQEYLVENLKHDLPATWMLGCGISLSFLAGDVPRAPQWMRRVGLEWVHRMLQEPRRLAPRYLGGNLPFALGLLVTSSWRRLLGRVR